MDCYLFQVPLIIIIIFILSLYHNATTWVSSNKKKDINAKRHNIKNTHDELSLRFEDIVVAVLHVEWNKGV